MVSGVTSSATLMTETQLRNGYLESGSRSSDLFRRAATYDDWCFDGAGSLHSHSLWLVGAPSLQRTCQPDGGTRLLQ